MVTRRCIAIAAFAAISVSGAAFAQPKQSGLVNVDLSNFRADIAKDINVNASQVPVNVQVPVDVAATVCGVDANVLARQGVALDDTPATRDNLLAALRRSPVALFPERPVEPLDRNEGQAVGVDVVPHLVDIHLRREELRALRRVDSVEAAMARRRRGDPHVDFARAGVAHHLHDLHAGRAAHDRIVDQHDALALQQRAIGVML